MSSYLLAILAGLLLGVPVSGLLWGRIVDEKTFRRYLRRTAARRGWDWLLETCEVGEALAREALALKQVVMFGQCFESLKTLTYDARLAFGPAMFDGEQFVRIDADEDEGGLRTPVAIVSGGGPWEVVPLREATPERILEALGPADQVPLGWLLARASDEQLLRLPGTMRTSLVHALLRDSELPQVVEGLTDRFLKAQEVSA